MSPGDRRWYGPTVLLLLATGGLAFWAARRPWVQTRLDEGVAPGAAIDTLGTDVVAVSAALALVVAASALAVLAAGGWLRRAVGVVVVLVAAGGLASTFADSSDVVDQQVRESVAYGSGVAVVSDATVWPWITGLAFVLAAALGIVVAWWGGSWPTMGRRYEAPTSAVHVPDPANTHDWGRDAWKALDAGVDPTEDPTP